MLIAGKTEWLEEAIFGRSQQSTNGSVCNSCKLCTEALQHSAPLCCEEKRIRPVALPWTVDAWPTSLLTTFRRRRSIRSQGLQAAHTATTTAAATASATKPLLVLPPLLLLLLFLLLLPSIGKNPNSNPGVHSIARMRLKTPTQGRQAGIASSAVQHREKRSTKLEVSARVARSVRW